MINLEKTKELNIKPERVRALITEIEQQWSTTEIRKMQTENQNRNCDKDKYHLRY